MNSAWCAKRCKSAKCCFKAAPHIIWPLRFVMPHDKNQRPEWMIRCGLFLYDHLARREVLPGSETVSFANHPAGQPIKPAFKRGFVYSDGWVQDARLVVLNAKDAAERGARACRPAPPVSAPAATANTGCANCRPKTATSCGCAPARW